MGLKIGFKHIFMATSNYEIELKAAFAHFSIGKNGKAGQMR